MNYTEAPCCFCNRCWHKFGEGYHAYCEKHAGLDKPQASECWCQSSEVWDAKWKFCPYCGDDKRPAPQEACMCGAGYASDCKRHGVKKQEEVKFGGYCPDCLKSPRPNCAHPWHTAVIPCANKSKTSTEVDKCVRNGQPQEPAPRRIEKLSLDLLSPPGNVIVGKINEMVDEVNRLREENHGQARDSR